MSSIQKTRYVSYILLVTLQPKPGSLYGVSGFFNFIKVFIYDNMFQVFY